MTLDETRQKWHQAALKFEEGLAELGIPIDPIVTLTLRLQAIEEHLFGDLKYDPQTDEHPMVHATGARLEYEMKVIGRLNKIVEDARPAAEQAKARATLLGPDGQSVGGFNGLAVPGT